MLTADHAAWTLFGGWLRPLHHLLQPDPVLDWLAQHRYPEFRHGAGRIDVDFAGAELGDGESHGFVERFGINLNRVLDPIGIDEGDLAAGERHARIIARFSLFVRLYR